MRNSTVRPQRGGESREAWKARGRMSPSTYITTDCCCCYVTCRRAATPAVRRTHISSWKKNTCCTRKLNRIVQKKEKREERHCRCTLGLESLYGNFVERWSTGIAWDKLGRLKWKKNFLKEKCLSIYLSKFPSKKKKQSTHCPRPFLYVNSLLEDVDETGSVAML